MEKFCIVSNGTSNVSVTGHVKKIAQKGNCHQFKSIRKYLIVKKQKV